MKHIRYSDQYEAILQRSLHACGRKVDQSLYTEEPQNKRKLTMEQAECIRKLRSAGVQLKTLGRMFGVSYQAIQRILKGDC